MIDQPLTLPCGVTLSNRLAKAAMTEGLADPRGYATPELERLYGLWSDGGAGMLLSGNIQIDADHLERPGNVIIDAEPDAAAMAALRTWAAAATRNGNQFWAQISHAGRQTMTSVNPHPKAPSSVKLGLPGGQFGQPVALTADEIGDIVAGFARTARVVVAAGFTGIQIHAAHGYLISQFLSPRSNQRTDQWGGPLENRARLLLDIVAACRAELGPKVPVTVKLNSADFQRGGFAFEDSLTVARWLQDAGVDLIEVSGGTYEQPRLIGAEGIEPADVPNVAESTKAREAYFVDFAKAMKGNVTIPLMVTGGFRTRAAMEEALASGAADLIGLGRPLCVETDGPAKLLAGANALPAVERELSLFPSWLQGLTRIKAIRGLATFAVQYWYYGQIYAFGRTGKARSNLSVFTAFRETEATHKAWLKARRG
jgi:2,4-dienoyl-CoA reductase-like NADH-dependent reductase (Old Yellow Enzyme family)